MLDKVPEWVRELPEDDENKALLLRVAEVGMQSLGTSREFTFGIKNFTDENSVRSAAQEVISYGWNAYLSKSAVDDSMLWLEARSDRYIISESGLAKDESFFADLAEKYEVTYDGWYTEVV